jgi:hypothetical protein
LKVNYTRVFWGIILVYFNINLGPVDILPNFIGYYLIASGLAALSEENPSYNIGKIPAACMIFISFACIFIPSNIYSKSLIPPNAWSLGIPGIFAVINLVILFSICKGVYNEAEFYGNTDLMNKAKVRWYWQLFLTAVNLILVPFMLTMMDSVTAFFWIIVIASFISVMFVAGLLRLARDKMVDIEENS